MLTLEGIYDGEVVRFIGKQSLPANISVKVLVDEQFGKNQKKKARQLTTEKQIALSLLLDTQWETGGYTFKRDDLYNERLDTTFGKL